MLLTLLGTLIVAALVLWAVSQLPLDPTIVTIIRVVVVVVLVLYVLRYFHMLPS